MFNLSIPKVVVANNKKMSSVLFAIDICNGMCMKTFCVSQETIRTINTVGPVPIASARQFSINLS